MKKLTYLLTITFSLMLFSSNSMAYGEANQSIEKKEENKSVAKKKRRKKVQMCNECGKPETKCECEGEGHGVTEDNHQH
jgi:hypothetical protein